MLTSTVSSRIPTPTGRRGGFTLMEMMVAVSILVLMIMAIGKIFQDASKAVSLSQISMELFSNVRSAQDQIARDVSAIDRNGFLVIRSQYMGEPWDSTTTPNKVEYVPGAQVIYGGIGYVCIKTATAGTPPSVGPNWQLSSNRADQICFVSTSAFANRTGNNSPNPFADRTTSNGAVVWYGHLIFEGTPSRLAEMANNNSIVAAIDKALPLNVTAASPPESMRGFDCATTPNVTPLDQDYVLGRHTSLLMAGNGSVATGTNSATNSVTMVDGKTTVLAFTDVILAPATSTTLVNVDGSVAHITTSRIAIASLTPGQVMQNIMNQVTTKGRGNPPPNGGARYEADNYCYRFKVLPNPYATEIPIGGPPNLVNGTFRMHPILLQGCGSFKVEWTDGGSSGLKWYGLPAGNTVVKGDTTIEPPLANGDVYTAIFSFDNKTKWPKALKISYHITDAKDRLLGGREFTQVVALPN